LLFLLFDKYIPEPLRHLEHVENDGCFGFEYVGFEEGVEEVQGEHAFDLCF
jgi:hypothetical protein